MTKPDKNARAHYRVLYPIGDRPKFRCQGEILEVIDVSERGLAVTKPKRAMAPNTTTELSGQLTFTDGEVVEVTGRVLRVTADSVIFLLSKGVPLKTMMNQQRLMIKKYGDLHS